MLFWWIHLMFTGFLFTYSLTLSSLGTPVKILNLFVSKKVIWCILKFLSQLIELCKEGKVNKERIFIHLPFVCLSENVYFMWKFMELKIQDNSLYQIHGCSRWIGNVSNKGICIYLARSLVALTKYKVNLDCLGCFISFPLMFQLSSIFNSRWWPNGVIFRKTSFSIRLKPH